MKLRNTYHVPAGQIVTVDTPEGEVTYRGGQFVPPEQLGQAKFKSAADSQGEGNEGQKGAEGAGVDWKEIAENYKGLNINDARRLNEGSYSLNDFVNIPIKTSSTKIIPACRFAVEFAVANLLNSIPGLKNIIQDSPLTINILDKKDVPGKFIRQGDDLFEEIGRLDFDEEQLFLWQIGKNAKEVFENSAAFIGFKLGLLIIHLLHRLTETQKSQLPKIKDNIEQLEIKVKQLIDKYVSENKGKMPKPGQNEEIDSTSEDLDNAKAQLEQVQATENILKELKDVVYKEKGIDAHVQKHLDSDKDSMGMGVYEQFAHILSRANLRSFKTGKNFDVGMQEVAQKYPETTSKMKSLFELLNASNRQQ